MKLAHWLAAILCLLLAVPVVRAQTIVAPSPTPAPLTSVILAPDVFVRGGPGRDYIPVGRLVAGDRLLPVARDAQTMWVMIIYNAGFGWVRRDLAYWADDIESLPIVNPDNLTPSPVPGRATVTPFLPSPTPAGNWVRVGPEGAFVRAGPGRSYLRLDTLESGTLIDEPVGQNADGQWIMFRFGDGFGWISRILVRWSDDLNNLPVLSEDALTPTATFTPSSTPTHTYTPTATLTLTLTPTSTATITPSLTATSTPTPFSTLTATATATYTNTPTATESATSTPAITPTATASDTPAPSPTVTATSTDTPTAVASNTPLPSDTATATSTATSSPTATASDTPALSPTVTATSTDTATAVASDTPLPSATASATTTNTPTPSPTLTATHTASFTPTLTITPSATHTPTAVDTASPTPLPTSTPTLTPSLTSTDAPTPTFTATWTATATNTMPPTATATQTVVTQIAAIVPSATVTASRTPAPTNTQEPTATRTSTPAPSQTLTHTPTATLTATATQTPTDSPTNTPTHTATGTEILTQTLVRTDTNTPRPTASHTPAAMIGVLTPSATLVPQLSGSGDSGEGQGRAPLEAIVGGVLLAAIIGYMAFYLRGMAAAGRYAGGFVVDRCPACRRGQLTVESRSNRLLGIPRPRRIVRCDTCRSVLRETGSQQWRYAIDPVVNAALYERYNGREIDEADLKKLAQQPIVPDSGLKPPLDPPAFIDHDDQ